MSSTRETFLLLCIILGLLSTTSLAQPSYPDFTTGILSHAKSVFVTQDDYVIFSDGSSSAVIYSCTGTSCTSVASYQGGSHATYESGVLVTTDGTNIYYYTCPTYSSCSQLASTPVFNSGIASIVLSNGTIFAGYTTPGYVVPYNFSNGQLMQGTPQAPDPSSCVHGCLFYGASLAALDGQYVAGDFSEATVYYRSRNFTVSNGPIGTYFLELFSFGYSVALGFDSSSGLQLLFVSQAIGNNYQGQVYVYTCSISNCQFAFTLQSPTPTEFYAFTIAANGNKLLVSEPVGGSSGNELIYLYTCTSTGCNLVASFYPSYSSPNDYGLNSMSIGVSLAAQVDASGNPSVFSLAPIFSGSAYSPSSITSIPTVPHPRHDCLISNGVINDGGFTITTSDETDYCCRFQGIIQGGQCGAIKCLGDFVAQGVSTYFENDDGSHCFALCYTLGSETTSVPIFQGSQYQPSPVVSLSTTVQGGLDCLISSGTVNDAGYQVTDPSNNQYCCRLQGAYAFGVCTHQVCGTAQPWGSGPAFYDPSNTCYGQCFAFS